jgi:hypothetical protein
MGYEVRIYNCLFYRKLNYGKWEHKAERVGFEPTVVLRLHRFSRPTDSTTLAPLQKQIEPRLLRLASMCERETRFELATLTLAR